MRTRLRSTDIVSSLFFTFACFSAVVTLLASPWYSTWWSHVCCRYSNHGASPASITRSSRNGNTTPSPSRLSLSTPLLVGLAHGSSHSDAFSPRTDLKFPYQCRSYALHAMQCCRPSMRSHVQQSAVTAASERVSTPPSSSESEHWSHMFKMNSSSRTARKNSFTTLRVSCLWNSPPLRRAARRREHQRSTRRRKMLPEKVLHAAFRVRRTSDLTSVAPAPPFPSSPAP